MVSFLISLALSFPSLTICFFSSLILSSKTEAGSSFGSCGTSFPLIARSSIFCRNFFVSMSIYSSISPMSFFSSSTALVMLLAFSSISPISSASDLSSTASPDLIHVISRLVLSLSSISL